jgi:hypothetical protein
LDIFCQEIGKDKTIALTYSSNEITKKEPKSEAHVSKFYWHYLSSNFLATMLLHNLKVFLKPIKHHLLAIH